MDRRRLKRFRRYVKRDSETKCWNWVGPMNKGRGRMRIEGEYQPVHRVAYEHWVGLIPDGHFIHHLCGNKGCVNPRHLTTMTPSDHTSLHHDSP